MSSTDFLNDLLKRYGDISLKNFLSRIVRKGVKIISGKNTVSSTPIKTASENFSRQSSPQSELAEFDRTPKNTNEPSANFLIEDKTPNQGSLKSVEIYGINNIQKKNYDSGSVIRDTTPKPGSSPLINRRYPIARPDPPKHKFLPVNIGGLKDWWELRQIVLDLHEFTNFFSGKQDSQSPQFLELIKNYANEAEKNLAQPAEMDESASLIFVKKLAKVIQERFYKILKSCKPGLDGKGKLQRSYYQALDLLIKNYFKTIGLTSGNVRARSDFRDWREHMTVSAVKEALFSHMDNTIFEVEVQPYYFKYINEDGEEKEFWIDGECTIYKKKVMS